jgi:hypothetical protein
MIFSENRLPLFRIMHKVQKLLSDVAGVKANERAEGDLLHYSGNLKLHRRVKGGLQLTPERAPLCGSKAGYRV